MNRSLVDDDDYELAGMEEAELAEDAVVGRHALRRIPVYYLLASV